MENRFERQRKLDIAVITLAGIVICGVALVSLAVILGNRLRRLARAPLPKQSKLDELWFLKPNNRQTSSENRGGTGPPPRENSSDDEETNTA